MRNKSKQQSEAFPLYLFLITENRGKEVCPFVQSFYTELHKIKENVSDINSQLVISLQKISLVRTGSPAVKEDGFLHGMKYLRHTGFLQKCICVFWKFKIHGSAAYSILVERLMVPPLLPDHYITAAGWGQSTLFSVFIKGDKLETRNWQCQFLGMCYHIGCTSIVQCVVQFSLQECVITQVAQISQWYNRVGVAQAAVKAADIRALNSFNTF